MAGRPAGREMGPPDSEWTEVAKRTGSTVTLIILSDPGHRITRTAAIRILDQIGG